jgi:GNAT superfamily N-acetyltransferase
MGQLIEVRAPEPGEGGAIAEVQIRSWQVGYRGIFPGTYLDGLSGEIALRTARWNELIERYVPLDQLLVATIDGTVVSFSSFGPRGEVRDHSEVPQGASRREGEVYAFYTHPDHWRRGAGRLLMDATIDRLTAARYPSAVLWVLRDNPRARGFYEATGWEATGDESTFQRDTISAAEVCYRRPIEV